MYDVALMYVCCAGQVVINLLSYASCLYIHELAKTACLTCAAILLLICCAWSFKSSLFDQYARLVKSVVFSTY